MSSWTVLSRAVRDSSDNTWEKSGDYSSAATIRVRRLFECGDYSSAATIRERRLIERIR